MPFVAAKASIQKLQSSSLDLLAVHLSGHLQEERPRRPSWKRLLKLFGALPDGLTVHLEPKRFRIGASIRWLWTYETLWRCLNASNFVTAPQLDRLFWKRNVITQVSLIFSAIPSIASVWTLSHSVFWEPRAIIWGIRSDRKLLGVRQTATSPRFLMLEVWFSLQKGRSSVWKTRDSHSQCTVAICEAVLGLTDRRNGHSSNSQLP